MRVASSGSDPISASSAATSALTRPCRPRGVPTPNQLPHEEPQIEAARVNQQSLQNVRVPPQVHAAQAACLVEMREGPLQAFAAKPQQSQAPRATNAPPIPIHRGTGLRRVFPVASPAIRFRDVAPDTHGFEIHEGLIAVIALGLARNKFLQYCLVYGEA